MRRIILDLATTLDGFIEGPNGEIDWCIMDDDMDLEGFIETVDTIFYGRISYDAWGNFKPDANAGETEKAIWNGVHSKRKIVFSSQHRQDNNTEFISTDIINSIHNIRQQAGKDIWLYGGARLIETFIHFDLIDIYRISVHPVALGKGKPLFENLQDRLQLKLTATNVFKSGVVQLIYEK